MRKFSERYILDVIKGRRKGMIAATVRSLLRFLSWGYHLGAWLNDWSFDNGWRRKYFPPVPTVISIGNIVAGGTGKTPVTLKLAKEFYQHIPLAILSRGYRSPAEKLASPLALCVGRGPVYPSSYAGDEPYLLAESLPEAFVYVGRDRKKASILAVKSGAELVILDDGMQSRNVARDVEIVVINGTDPLGQGHFLPRGLLRVSPKNLKRADLVIINHASDRADYLTAKHQISPYTSAPIVAMEPEISTISDLSGSKVYSLIGKKIGIFCGIANPELFKKLLESHGAIVASELYLPDHVSPKSQQLRKLAEQSQAAGAEYIVCTEKDKVKIVEDIDLPLPILWTQMQLKITDGEEHWQELIDSIHRQASKKPAHPEGVTS